LHLKCSRMSSSRRRLAGEIKRNVKIRKVEASVPGVSTIRKVSSNCDVTRTVYNLPPLPEILEPILAPVPLPPPKSISKDDDGVEREGEDEEKDKENSAKLTRVSHSFIIHQTI